MLTTKVFRKIADITPEEWNKIFPAVLENYYFFKSLDESDFEQFKFYYILVYEGGMVVGATSCFLMKYPLETTASGWVRKVLETAKKMLPAFFNLKILICGLPMGRGRIGFRGTDRGPVVKAITSAMNELARSEKVSIVAFKDFGSEYTDVLACLEQDGFYRFQSMPSTEMKVGFGNFEEYLKTLSSSSRESIRRKYRKVDGGVKLDMEITDRLNGAIDEVYDLYLQTQSRGDMQFEILPRKYFEVVSRNMPQETKYFLWRMNGKLVAFAQCFATGDYFIDYYLGFDYSIAHDYHLYFIRFRDLMNWCIQNGMKTYEMGPTGYEPKRRLGFEFVPLYVHAKHRNGLINPFFKLLCFALKPENTDPVFKQMTKENTACKEAV